MKTGFKNLFYSFFLAVLFFGIPFFAKAETWDEANKQAKEQAEQNQQSLYRNDEHHFRIKFPAGWEIKDGDGEHIVKKAVNNSGSTVLIQARDFASSIDKEELESLSAQDRSDIQNAEISSFSDEDINDFSSEMINGMLGAFPGSKVLEKNIGYVDNRKAIYFKLNQIYKVQDLQVEGISINYITIHKGKMFQLGGFYPKGEDKQEATIKESLSTFVFEDWNNPVSIDKASASSDLSNGNLNGWGIFLVIISSIIFTWGFGLLIPTLLRFVFLKRPLSKTKSFLIVFILWFIQLVFYTSLDTKSRTHNALVLVAVASYWILRAGASDKIKINKEIDEKLETTKFCKECGSEIHESATICNDCGKELPIKS
ncbi:MAG: hypothetical protein WC120_04745 [Parcubacteria group bacterium]